MASFFGEVITGPYRFIDDEDEDLIGASKSSTFTLTEAVDKEEKLLIFADKEFAVAFTKLLGSNLKIISKIVTETKEIAKILRSTNVTVVQNSVGTSQEDNLALGTLVLELAGSNCRVIALTSKHVSECVTSQTSSAHGLCSSSWPSPLPCPSLPLPTLLTGTPAAILTLAQISARPCLVLVAWTDVSHVDSLALQGFNCLFDLAIVKEVGLMRPKDMTTAMVTMVGPAKEADNLYL